MTYLDLINQFWRKDYEYSFTTTEVTLYFRLLYLCNHLAWKSPFNMGVDKLMAQMGLKTKKPLDTARKRLREAGLLEFKNGNGRGCTTEYTIIGVGNKAQKQPKRSNKNAPLSPPLSVVLPKPFSGGASGLLHKMKNRIEKEEANALGGSCESKGKKRSLTERELEKVHNDHLNTDELQAMVSELAGLWHIIEDKNLQTWAKLTQFIQAIDQQGRLDELRKQFAGYRDFFRYAGITPHNLGKYIGDKINKPPYADGKWCECDWSAKAQDRKPRTTNGIPGTPIRASATPSNQKTWKK